MLFRNGAHAPIVRGEITRTIRRWRRPQARAGGSYRLGPAGTIEVDAVTPIETCDLTEDDAIRSGFESIEELLAAIPDREGTTLYRIKFHYLGQTPDPRAVLAADVDLDSAQLQTLTERLAAMDRRSGRPWTRPTLDQIEAHPGTVSHTLAAAIDFETAPFKANVRKLKALGLTISLETGYELSPRGRALLAYLRGLA